MLASKKKWLPKRSLKSSKRKNKRWSGLLSRRSPKIVSAYTNLREQNSRTNSTNLKPTAKELSSARKTKRSESSCSKPTRANNSASSPRLSTLPSCTISSCILKMITTVSKNCLMFSNLLKVSQPWMKNKNKRPSLTSLTISLIRHSKMIRGSRFTTWPKLREIDLKLQTSWWTHYFSTRFFRCSWKLQMKKINSKLSKFCVIWSNHLPIENALQRRVTLDKFTRRCKLAKSMIKLLKSWVGWLL